MTAIILSNGIMTIRKPKQSIKNHIAQHEKNWWISEFMRLAEVNYETALKEWEKVFIK